MAGLRFTELQSRPMEFLDFTSLTPEEFQQLVPPFETAFHARMAAWRMDGKPRTARRFTIYKNCPLPTPEDRLLFILVYLKTYTLQVVHGRVFGMVQGKANQWIHVLLPALLAALRALGDAPARSLTALAQRLGISEATAATVVTPARGVRTRRRRTYRHTGGPPFAHDGTERRIVHPQDPVEQQESYSGKKKDNTVKNVLLVNAFLTILFLSDTHGGRTHDLRILSFTLPQVEILMPTKKPRGAELTLEQDLANQVLHQRRLRIEHVNSSVKRCRIVKDRIRLWKEGVRDLVMELCCALHNFRVRLTPWQPMI